MLSPLAAAILQANGAPAGVPKLPARPPAAAAAAGAASRRAAAAAAAASGSSTVNATPASTSNGASQNGELDDGQQVNIGPAIKQAAAEIAHEAGLAMADAGIPLSSGPGGIAAGPFVNGNADQRGVKAASGISGSAPSDKDVSNLKVYQPTLLYAFVHLKRLDFTHGSLSIWYALACWTLSSVFN